MFYFLFSNFKIKQKFQYIKKPHFGHFAYYLYFFKSLPDVFETKTDHLLGHARTEYHCKKCGGHHGHIFDDGPQPTGKRYCNNGICLVFKGKI